MFKLSLSKKQSIWGYIFISASMIYFFVVFLIPMFQAFYFSVLNYSSISFEKSYAGLENYKSLLHDEVFFKSLWNTIRFSLVRASLVLLLGLITALLLQNLTRFKNVLRTILILPWMTSGVAMAWIFNYLYSLRGPITSVMEEFGVKRPALLTNTHVALYAIAAVSIWGALGYYTLLFEVGLDAIPTEIYDAAKVDGASAWQNFRHITIPLLNPTIVFVSVIGVSASLKNFDLIRSMTGIGGPLNSTLTLPLNIYLEAFSRFNMGRAAAMTLIFFLLVLSVTYIQIKLITKDVTY
jgi:multiple sugar transport system permease protein